MRNLNQTSHRAFALGAIISISVSLLAASANASSTVPQFVNETDARLQAPDHLVKNDLNEKMYAWGDLNNNGWVDLVIMRKQPFNLSGKRENVLLTNENGILVDRTAQYASAFAEDQLPGETDSGFLTPTCDRFAVIVDLNDNGWLDVVTAMELSPHDPKHIGHPRIYMNLGNNVSEEWLGLRFENQRIPHMCSNAGNCQVNPNFIAVTAGDITNNGLPDLYFSGYEKGAPAGTGFGNRLLINSGNGYFADETLLRMGSLFNYGGTIGMQNYAWAFFGSSAVIGDFNDSGYNDVVRVITASDVAHVAIKYNDSDAPGAGHFADYTVVNSQSLAYTVATADLNQNGRLDLVVAADFVDGYILNLGTNDGSVAWSSKFSLPGPSGFVSNITLADLNNNGWTDIIIADTSAEIASCSRFTNIYANNQQSPSASFTNISSVIPQSQRQGVFHVAAFDITGNGWTDLVIGRCAGTGIWINEPPFVPCPADLTGSGAVNVFDLLELLSAWGPSPGHPADLTDDGVVNVFDLLELLAQWGPCP